MAIDRGREEKNVRIGRSLPEGVGKSVNHNQLAKDQTARRNNILSRLTGQQNSSH